MTARNPVRRVVFFIVFVLVAFSVMQYVFDARARAVARECQSVISKSGSYRAESCVTGGDGNVLIYVGRLYDVRSGELLARTDFDSLDGGLPEFMPDESAVLFRRGEGNGSGAGVIAIPPNWLERLRAKIP
ncbi:hypothetical protein [Paraburkholderia sp. J94]|uniref:hypothetical protein n=1 Tax=Paraburkholderia sp. J94 TaxID=2805441 RepID=UPI002AB06351|nr:hypothetical protein [Paraburkholderia sp. J94]